MFLSITKITSPASTITRSLTPKPMIKFLSPKIEQFSHSCTYTFLLISFPLHLCNYPPKARQAPLSSQQTVPLTTYAFLVYCIIPKSMDIPSIKLYCSLMTSSSSSSPMCAYISINDLYILGRYFSISLKITSALKTNMPEFQR